MADMRPDLSRDKETGENVIDRNDVIDRDRIVPLEEPSGARAFVPRAVPWDCRRDLHEVPCYMRSRIVFDVDYCVLRRVDMLQDICDNPRCREKFLAEQGVTSDRAREIELLEAAMAGDGEYSNITSAKVGDICHHESNATTSAMAGNYECNRTTSARAEDIDHHEHNPATAGMAGDYEYSNTTSPRAGDICHPECCAATSDRFSESQCGNEDPMFLTPSEVQDILIRLSGVQDKNLEDFSHLGAKNFESAADEKTSDGASDIGNRDVGGIMSERTCSKFRKATSDRFLQCSCYDPRYIGPGVDASVQNKEKDCVHVNIEEFENDVGKTPDNVDDVNSDANAKVVIEVIQKTTKKAIGDKRRKKDFVLRIRNNLTGDDWVCVRLPGSSAAREQAQLLLLSLFKALCLFLFLRATMMLLKRHDPALDNFFSCLTYNLCNYFGGALVVFICGGALIKFTEFAMKRCASNMRQFYAVMLALNLTMLCLTMLFIVLE